MARSILRTALRLQLPLIAIFVVAATVSGIYAAQVDSWKVMQDELFYVKLAISVSDSLSPLPRIHGLPIAIYSQAYPVLAAPLFWVFDMPTAFKAMHVLGAILMASTAFPAYLLARSAGLGRMAAHLAAAVTVAVPWVTLSTVLFTEVAGYPAFIWAVYAIHHALVRPSLRSDLLAVLAIVIAIVTRTQFVVLLLALPAILLAHEAGFALLSRPRERVSDALRRSARAHPGFLAGLALAAVVVLALALGAGGLQRALGHYSDAGQGDLLPEGIWTAARVNFNQIVVGIGVLPAILAFAHSGAELARPRSREGHAFAVLLLGVGFSLLVVVSSFDVRFSPGGAQERYFFYVAPLLVIGMLKCLDEPRLRFGWVWVLAAGAFVYWSVRFGGLSSGPGFSSPASGFYQVLAGRAWEIGRLIGNPELHWHTLVVWTTAAITVVAAAALALRPLPLRYLTAAAGLVVLAYCGAQTLWLFPKSVDATTGGGLAPRGPAGERDWVDQLVDGDAKVGLVPTVTGDRADLAQDYWWDVEFWNKRVNRSYAFPGLTSFTNFPQHALELDPRTGALSAVEESDYLVVPGAPVRLGIAASRSYPGPTATTRLALIVPARPWRADWVSDNISEDGLIEGRRASVRVFPLPGERPGGRRTTITLALTADVEEPRRVTLTVDGGRTSRVTLRPRRPVATSVDHCVAPRRPSRVAVETERATELPGSGGRIIGAQVRRIESVPFAGGCSGRDR